MKDSISVLNPLFDTVIQRNNYNYLHYHNRELDEQSIDELFIIYYTGILRWQMLVVGSVVLTDSMWYDSIFFKKLIGSGEHSSAEDKRTNSFEALCYFLKYNSQEKKTGRKAYPLKIRIRPQHISKMFFKEFYFSSILDYQLRGDLLEAGRKIPEIIESGKNPEENPQRYTLDTDMDRYKKLLQCACENNSEKNEIPKSIGNENRQWARVETLFEYVKYLGNALSQVCSDLPYNDGNWPKNIQWNEDPFRRAFSKVKATFEKKYCYIDEKGVHAPQNEHLKTIWEELKSEKPKRSVIEDNLEKIKGEWREPVIKEFYDVFEEEYNRAIAVTQQLEYLDCREVFERELFLKKTNKDSVMCSVMQFLGGMSWEEFQKLYDASLPGRRSKVRKAQEEPGKFVLLGEEAGGTMIQGESLYDRIFIGRVSFMKLNGFDRMFSPQKFGKQIECKGGKLAYKDCALFSNRTDPNIKSYFHENFDADAAKTLLCPRIVSPLQVGDPVK